MKRKRTKRRLRWFSRGAIVRLGLLAVVTVVFGVYMMWMPGKSYRGPLPPLTPVQTALRDELRRDVEHLASVIGERNVWLPDALDAAAKYGRQSFEQSGYRVGQQDYETNSVTCSNLHVQIDGAKKPEEIVIVGAHYDSIMGSPGADDNATGVAAVLALARAFAGKSPGRTLRLVAFVNEEPPFFQQDDMGSFVYARRCKKDGDNIVAMIAFDGLGHYSDLPDSQQYPLPVSFIYPTKGNFIGFVGNLSSRSLLRRVVRSFRRHARFPSEGAALPAAVPGAGWSDQWSFWQCGYRGVMVTDTLPYRYEHYHEAADTPDKIDFDRMARVVAAMELVVADLVAVK